MAQQSSTSVYGLSWFLLFAVIGALLIITGVLGYQTDDPHSRPNSHTSWFYITMGVWSFAIVIFSLILRYMEKRKKRANRPDSTSEMTSSTDTSKGGPRWFIFAVGVLFMVFGAIGSQIDDPHSPINSNSSLSVFIAGAVFSAIGLGILIFNLYQRRRKTVLCRKCGMWNQGDFTFCSNCGSKIQFDNLIGYFMDLLG